MSVRNYFINDTKKQVVSSKKLYGDFEDKQQLLCYLCMCEGDTIRIEREDSKWVDEFEIEGIHNEYKKINLHEFKIKTTDNIYESNEFDRLEHVVFDI